MNETGVADGLRYERVNPNLRSPPGIWARTLLIVCPFTMTVIVPFLTTTRMEFTSVGPVLTRLFVVVSKMRDRLGVSTNGDKCLKASLTRLTEPLA